MAKFMSKKKEQWIDQSTNCLYEYTKNKIEFYSSYVPNLKFVDVYKLIILGYDHDQMDFVLNYNPKDELTLMNTAKLYDEVHELELENASKLKLIEKKKKKRSKLKIVLQF